MTAFSRHRKLVLPVGVFAESCVQNSDHVVARVGFVRLWRSGRVDLCVCMALPQIPCQIGRLWPVLGHWRHTPWPGLSLCRHRLRWLLAVGRWRIVRV